MDISGSYAFNATSERVWALLMDTAVLSSCIPGCDTFQPDGADRYKVTLTVGLAAITGTSTARSSSRTWCRRRRTVSWWKGRDARGS